jgi:NAD(P)-dependent dehydrogenase (short-subunit alcohol dehydrogenase family)
MRLSGRTALVTGAAGGIGAAIVKGLRTEGALVAVADRDVSGIDADAHLPGVITRGPVPLGRIAEPEDISDVVLFLASDAARYMCGALVEVNGGKPVS